MNCWNLELKIRVKNLEDLFCEFYNNLNIKMSYIVIVNCQNLVLMFS